MIYYSNSRLDDPHMAFIGRWSPFHKGHTAIIMKKLQEKPHSPVLILIRNTSTDMYPPGVRAQYIKLWMQNNHIKGTIMIVPDIEGVYWGRDVGYNVEMVNVDCTLKQISGTQIRQLIHSGSNDWASLVAHSSSSPFLSRAISRIIEKGLVVWLTGCPSSGKTTIAKELNKQLHECYPYLKTQILDGDQMRASPLAEGVGFSQKDRAGHILRMAHLAKMFADQGILVICAFVSPDRKVRTTAKKIVDKNRFVEVYVSASLKNRIKRDKKGLYKKAKKGMLPNLTGFNAPYEPPITPQLKCDTDRQNVKSCVCKILTYLF